MYARSTNVQAQPSNIDAGIAFVRDEVMPALQDMDGYIGLSLLVDRESGRCIATSAWETEDALGTSTDQAAPLRERAAEIFGGDVTVERWEIAVLHRDHRASEGACVRATWVKIAARAGGPGYRLLQDLGLSRKSRTLRASAAPAC